MALDTVMSLLACRTTFVPASKAEVIVPGVIVESSDSFVAKTAELIESLEPLPIVMFLGSRSRVPVRVSTPALTLPLKLKVLPDETSMKPPAPDLDPGVTSKWLSTKAF